MIRLDIIGKDTSFFEIYNSLNKRTKKKEKKNEGL